MSLIARNSLFLSIAKFFSISIYAVFGLVLARQVTTDQNGVYSLMTTLLFFGGMISSFGIPLVITREVSRNKDKLVRFFYEGILAVRLGAFLATLVLGVYITVEQYLRGEVHTQIYLLFFLVMLTALVDAAAGVCDALFQAYEKMATPALVEILTGLLRAGGAMMAIYVAPPEFRVHAVFIIFAVGSSLRFFFMSKLVRSNLFSTTDLDLRHSVKIIDAWKLIKSSGFIAVFRVLRMLRNRLDVLLLGVLFVSAVEGVQANPDVARGIYMQAVRVAIIFHTITIAFNTALFPRLARETEDKNSLDGIRSTYSRAVRWQSFWAIPLACMVWLYSDGIAQFFGTDYLNGSPESGVLGTTGDMLKVLLIAVVFDCIGGPIGSIMLGYKEMEKKIPKIGLLLVGISLILNIILIPRYGILGAAIASAITAGFEFILKVGIVSRRLGSPLLILSGIFPFLIFTSISLFIILVAQPLGVLQSWIVFGLIYLTLCLLFKKIDPVIFKLLSRLGRN